jgi:hypothetical protein
MKVEHLQNEMKEFFINMGGRAEEFKITLPVHFMLQHIAELYNRSEVRESIAPSIETTSESSDMPKTTKEVGRQELFFERHRLINITDVELQKEALKAAEYYLNTSGGKDLPLAQKTQILNSVAHGFFIGHRFLGDKIKLVN